MDEMSSKTLDDSTMPEVPLTPEEIEEQEAFTAAFNRSMSAQRNSAAPTTTPSAVVEATGTGDKPAVEAPKPSEPPVSPPPSGPTEPASADPYAGLPPATRALIESMQSEIAATRRRAETAEQLARTESGRVNVLQGRFDKLRQAAADPARRANLDKVRDAGWPEVADAVGSTLDLVSQTDSDDSKEPPNAQATTAGPTTPPEPAAPAVSAQPSAKSTPVPGSVEAEEAALSAVRPSWENDLQSAQFLQWLAQQAPEKQQTIKTTGKASVINSALVEFDQHQAAQRTRQQAVDDAKARMEAAAMPAGSRGAAAEPQTPQDAEEAAFSAAFKPRRRMHA